MISNFWNGVANVINAILSVVFYFLPVSPFKGFWQGMANNEVIQYMNWFIPVGDFVVITGVWLSAIIVFYAYQIILRWVKAIDS